MGTFLKNPGSGLPEIKSNPTKELKMVAMFSSFKALKWGFVPGLVNCQKKESLDYLDNDVKKMAVDDSAMRQSLVSHSGGGNFKSFRRRWYILALFAGLTLHQAWIYCTYGPICGALKHAYGWSDSTTAMTANAGTAAYLLFTWPVCYLMLRLGTRRASLIITALVTLAASARSFATSGNAFAIATFTCMIVNGAGGVLSAAGTPFIASLWFKESERISATSIILAANMIGVGAADLLGPEWLSVGGRSDYDDVSPDEMRMQILWYSTCQTSVLAILLLCMLAYFPSKPEIPPTAMANSNRLNLTEGILHLMSNTSSILCVVAYSISFGVSGHWIGVMAINFEPLGIEETEVGQKGLGLVAGAAISSIIFARYMDYFRSQMKLALMAVLSLSSLCILWLTLTVENIIPFSKIQVWTATIVGISAVCATRSLFFEFTTLVARPAPEALVGAVLNAGFNLVGVLFLSLYGLEDYGIGYSWINYCLLLSIFVSVPIVAMAKQPSDYQGSCVAIA